MDILSGLLFVICHWLLEALKNLVDEDTLALLSENRQKLQMKRNFI